MASNSLLTSKYLNNAYINRSKINDLTSNSINANNINANNINSDIINSGDIESNIFSNSYFLNGFSVPIYTRFIGTYKSSDNSYTLNVSENGKFTQTIAGQIKEPHNIVSVLDKKNIDGHNYTIVRVDHYNDSPVNDDDRFKLNGNQTCEFSWDGFEYMFDSTCNNVSYSKVVTGTLTFLNGYDINDSVKAYKIYLFNYAIQGLIALGFPQDIIDTQYKPFLKSLTDTMVYPIEFNNVKVIIQELGSSDWAYENETDKNLYNNIQDLLPKMNRIN